MAPKVFTCGTAAWGNTSPNAELRLSKADMRSMPLAPPKDGACDTSSGGQINDRVELACLTPKPSLSHSQRVIKSLHCSLCVDGCTYMSRHGLSPCRTCTGCP
jgi:hypothetical protein